MQKSSFFFFCFAVEGEDSFFRDGRGIERRKACLCLFFFFSFFFFFFFLFFSFFPVESFSQIRDDEGSFSPFLMVVANKEQTHFFFFFFPLLAGKRKGAMLDFPSQRTLGGGLLPRPSAGGIVVLFFSLLRLRRRIIKESGLFLLSLSPRWRAGPFLSF